MTENQIDILEQISDNKGCLKQEITTLYLNKKRVCLSCPAGSP